MSPEISERAFEEAIECTLLQYGPDACAGDLTAWRETPAPYGETPPGAITGAVRRTTIARSASYRATSFNSYSRDAAQGVGEATQHHGADVVARFLNRLASEIERRGALDVLRSGIKDWVAGFGWLVSARQAASTRKSGACTRLIFFRLCASFATARRTRTVSISSCS